MFLTQKDQPSLGTEAAVGGAVSTRMRSRTMKLPNKPNAKNNI